MKRLMLGAAFVAAGLSLVMPMPAPLGARIVEAASPSIRAYVDGVVWLRDSAGRQIRAPGAAVSARRVSDGSIFRVTADSQGFYRIGLPTGIWVIQATATINGQQYAGECGTRAVINSTTSGTLRGYLIVMALIAPPPPPPPPPDPVRATITGTVWYITSRGFTYQAPGATVVATRTRDGRSFSAITDFRGYYRLGLPAGEYTLRATVRIGGVNYAGNTTQRALIGNTSPPFVHGFNINTYSVR